MPCSRLLQRIPGPLHLLRARPCAHAIEAAPFSFLLQSAGASAPGGRPSARAFGHFYFLHLLEDRQQRGRAFTHGAPHLSLQLIAHGRAGTRRPRPTPCPHAFRRPHPREATELSQQLLVWEGHMSLCLRSVLKVITCGLSSVASLYHMVWAVAFDGEY